MNLALLDPFRRQVPDRIDSTLALPRTFHPPRPPTSSTLLHASTASSSTSTATTSVTTASSSSGAVATSSSSLTETTTATGVTVPPPRKRRAAAVAARSTSSQIAASQQYSKTKSRGRKSKASSSSGTGAGGTNDDGNNNADGSNATGEGETNEWHSCFAVSFNQRGNYIGAGHGSGIVPIHDFASRTLSSIFAPPHSTLKKHFNDVKKKQKMKRKKMKKKQKQMRKQKLTKNKKQHDKKDKRKRKRSSSSGGGGEDDDDHNDEGDEDKEQMDEEERDGEEEEGEGDDNENEEGNDNDDEGDNDDEDEENENNSSSEGGTSSSSEKDYFYIPDPSRTVGSDQKTRKRKQEVLQKLEEEKKQQERLFQNGITSISWSRDSRTMLVASYKDSHVCLVNHDHPYGPEDAYFGLTTGSGVGGGNSTTDTETGANARKSPSPNLDNGSTNEKRSSAGTGKGMGEAKGTNADEEGDSEKERGDGDGSDVEQNQPTSDDAMISKAENMKRFVFKDALYVSDVELLGAGRGGDRGNEGDRASSSNPAHNLVELTSEELGILSKPPPYTYEEDLVLQRLSMRLEYKGCSIEQAYQATKKKIAQTTKYQTLIMGLPQPLAICAQIHPMGNGGLACLEDGSLVLFRMPYGGFEDHFYADHNLTGNMKSRKMRISGDYAYLSQPAPQRKDESADGSNDYPRLEEEDDSDSSSCMSYHIICATFDARGHKVYAATKCGKLILYQLDPQFEGALFPRDSGSPPTDPDIEDPSQFFVQKFSNVSVIKILSSGGSTAAPNQIVLSRNGQMVLLNCKDGVLRLYDTSTLWRESANEEEIYVKPKHTFQDLVSNSKWASCDFSGDGEYVVGGCNNYESGDKYELYFWNTVNGTLIDQLMGPQIHLYSLSWHPTRSFIAVGTSDGMVDIWGPRLDWTNFAPDFQSLQKNVEYVEKEDEFDVVLDVDHEEEAAKRNRIEEEAVVDVTAMDDESEDEDELFYFDAKMRNDKARV